jgi:nucleoside-diphosphate-sugar epimerase
MKILVTGSEGSLMQAVIPHLLAQGHTVVGVDNFFRYGKSERKRDYELVEGDLADASFAKKVVKGQDGIIQAAARIFGVGGFHKYPADILAHDITLHRHILLAAQEEGIKKVCYISSSMVYERCERHPSAEEDVFQARIPSTDYGLSKLVGERLSMAFQQQYGMKYVVWRPFNIITPHERAESEQGISHVFADFIQRIVYEKKNPLPIIGDGQQVRCFTWIDDVAKTIAKYTFDPKTDNEAFNLGNPEPIKMVDLANIIYEESQAVGLLPKTDKPLGFQSIASYSDDVIIRIPDVSKAQKQLGWDPSVKVREAVKRCLKSHV